MTREKNTEFENSLSDLITETFTTKEDLEDAIKELGDMLMIDYLEPNLKYYVVED